MPPLSGMVPVTVPLANERPASPVGSGSVTELPSTIGSGVVPSGAGNPLDAEPSGVTDRPGTLSSALANETPTPDVATEPGAPVPGAGLAAVVALLTVTTKEPSFCLARNTLCLSAL